MPQRYVLDASAGVEILNRTPAGMTLTSHTFRPGAEEWTVDHFYVEVARVIRRDVLGPAVVVRNPLTDLTATDSAPAPARAALLPGLARVED